MSTRPAVSLRGVVLAGLTRPLSFDLAAGDCVVLLDPDVTMRTALLGVIAGASAPAAGTVRAGAAAAVWHQDGLPEHMPVHQTMRRVLSLFDSSAEPRQVLEDIGLAHRLDHEPWAMSLGERRRVAIELACASGSPLVVLDEPERGLDARALRWLRGRLRVVQNQGRVVVMATHDAGLAEACGDFVIDDLSALG